QLNETSARNVIKADYDDKREETRVTNLPDASIVENKDIESMNALSQGECHYNEDEVYIATRLQHQPYTVNCPKKDELSKEPTERIVNQPRQTEQVQPAQQEEHTQLTQPAEIEIMAEPAKEKAKNAMPRVKH
ncbi:5318_t:CDS:2, partial [Acaulospora morrowiae]